MRRYRNPWKGPLALGVFTFILAILSFSWRSWGLTTGGTPELSAPEGQEAVSSEVPKAKRLVDLMVTPEPGGTRVVLVGDGDIPSYNAFTLKDPARIVLDIWDVSYDPRVKKMPVKTRDLTAVRIAGHPEKVRVVFDAAEGKRGVIPPFSLKRDGPKLILCVGQIARGEHSDLGGLRAPEALARGNELSQQVQDVPSSDLEGGTKSGAFATPSDEREEMVPPKQGLTEESARPSRSEAVHDDKVSLTGKETEESRPKVGASEAEGLEPKQGESVLALHETVTAPETASFLQSDTKAKSAVKVSVKEAKLEGLQAAPAAVGIAPLLQEEELTSKTNQREIALASPSAGQGVPPKRQEPLSRQPRGANRPRPEAVSLAQISTKTESSQGLQAEEEEEEEFRIITGMEPGRDYRGQRLVDLDFQDIELENVFRLLAEVSNFNIVVSEKVKGKITMRLKGVPWGQALDLVVSTQKLGMVQQGNIIRVAPLKDLIDEEKERRTLRQQKLQERLEAAKRLQEEKIAEQEREKKLRPFVTETIQLNYAKAKSVVDDQIKKGKLLTDERELKKQGMVFYDEKTNQITVTDYPEVIEEIKRYIQRVDKPTPQVLIEARVVKANKTFARELGIQWGGQFAEFERANEWAMGITGGIGGASPSTWRSRRFVTPGTTQFLPNSSWMVNLPATLFGTATPAIGFQIGKLLGDLINLDLRLSAAEQDGLTKIISRPKVMTLDNVEATIEQGRDMPYTQVNPEGQTSVVWKRASLKTNVTPLISPDGRVKMKIHVTDNRVDPTVTSSLGEPSILIREAGTEVLVRNGETVVIGGIVEETKTKAEQGVPWLKDTPILNWLFERKAVEDRLDEMLIFVTPFVIEAG